MQQIDLFSARHSDHADLNQFIMDLHSIEARMRMHKDYDASQLKSREFSLAYTALEEMYHWLRDLHDRKLKEGYR